MRKPKPYDHTDPRPPSRSQKKRDSAALQVLGGKLAELHESALTKLNLPPRLFEAIMDFKGLAKHEAKRRQLQFIGALMRETDADPLALAVEDIESGNRGQAREFHAVEAWRAALLAGDESGLEAIVALAPEDEQVEVRSKIRMLARNARAEAEKNKPPRSSRALFRLLRELRQAVPESATLGIDAQGFDQDFDEELAQEGDDHAQEHDQEHDQEQAAEPLAQGKSTRKTSF
ncbi:MAG: DUF615 domain-containing protein [Proteobacteria bacterium]|nr:DUF615 domain-containing protein [Pseudomonadota bacterium]